MGSLKESAYMFRFSCTIADNGKSWMRSRLFGAWLVQFWDSGRVGFMQILEMILDMNPYRLYTLKLH